MTDLKMFKELTECDAIASMEGEAKEVFKKHTKDLNVEYFNDNLGSLVAKLDNNNKGAKVLLVGHFDEVGFIVKRIDEKGFIYFSPVGGWVPHTLLAQRVRITTNKGKKYVGVIGSKPPHIMNKEEREKLVPIDEMFIDLGVKDKEEVEKLGIEIGDMITPVSEFTQMANPNFLLAKAWDNRVGIALAIDVLKTLNETKHDAQVYAGGTVQEEIGCRGARTISETIKPDLAIAIDVGLAGDVPGVTPNKCDTHLDNGPVLVIYDAGAMIPVKLKEYIIKIAKKHKIDLQFDIMMGGATDTANLQYANNGTLACSISLSTRYIHSHTSILSKKDYDATKQLLIEIIKTITLGDVKKLKNEF